MIPDIALAASAREWPDRLHRYLLDHGGGRVVARVMGPEQAVDESFDVLLIDDICSFLTPRLVAAVKQSGSEVVGVFDPVDGTDAKRRLLESGISDVIEADATSEEFIEKARETLTHRVPVIHPEEPPQSSGWSIGITGTSEGVGMTEVAIALARAVASELDVTLVDLDPVWPSIAQRLDLPVHPNIRTALDLVLHRSDHLSSGLLRAGDVAVIGGVADQGAGSPLSHAEVAMLLEAVGAESDVVIADLGPLDRSLLGLARGFDALGVVGVGDPVGIARLLRTVERALESVTDEAVVIVVNKTPRRFHDGEVRFELSRVFPTLPIVTLPFDGGLADCAWEGTSSKRGAFARSLGQMAALITESVER